MSETKKCRKCNFDKYLKCFSKHSGTKDKLDNRCKECVKDLKKKLIESNESKSYEIYDFDYNSYEWQVGKVTGTILEKENKRYEARVKINRKSTSKSFIFDKYESKEEAYKEAKKWLKETSDKNNLTRNQIRKIDNSIIEVKITKNEIMKTDLELLDLCQLYYIVAIKGKNLNSENYAGISINNKIVRFHNFITDFKMVENINKNPLDNRIKNLRDANNKINNVNRNAIKKYDNEHIVGVRYDKRYNSYVARIKKDGKEHSKSFNVKKFGNEAKRLAIEYRKELCEKFNGL